MDIREVLWRIIPDRGRISQGLCRRLARSFPGVFARRAHRPLFMVGFNNGGKSTIVRPLKHNPKLCVYPYEGNGELWFPGFFPWMESGAKVQPIWYDPDSFINAVVKSRTDDFLGARAHMGAYQWLKGGDCVLNDSGMLAALLPEVMNVFPDARIVHIVRDGRVVSYLAARREWSIMMRNPSKYRELGCMLDFQEVLRKMSLYWAWTLGRIESVAMANPGSVHELQYETWCTDPTEALRGISAFLDCEDRLDVPEWDDEIVNMNAEVIADFSSKDESTLLETIGSLLTAKRYL